MTKQQAAPAKAADAKAAPDAKGFIARQIERMRASRPDHSFEGFVAAVKAAIQFAEGKNWNTSDAMCEQIEHDILTALRVPAGISVDFVARDKKTNNPRLLIIAEWGYREAVEGTLSFGLHQAPPRPVK